MDYDGEVSKTDGACNKFQIHSNAGKVPSSIKPLREQNGGIHAAMASALVKEGGTKDDIKKGFEEAAKSI